MALPVLGTLDQWAVASLGRNERHRVVTLQYFHPSGEMLCPEMERVNTPKEIQNCEGVVQDSVSQRRPVEQRARPIADFGRVVKMEGTIKWFNNSKGYGFIGCENGPDVFVHYSGILGDGYRTLQEGDRVRFELLQGPKGPQAASVVKIEGIE
jgi:CspA family cold shock protein